MVQVSPPHLSLIWKLLRWKKITTDVFPQSKAITLGHPCWSRILWIWFWAGDKIEKCLLSWKTNILSDKCLHLKRCKTFLNLVIFSKWQDWELFVDASIWYPCALLLSQNLERKKWIPKFCVCPIERQHREQGVLLYWKANKEGKFLVQASDIFVNASISCPCVAGFGNIFWSLSLVFVLQGIVGLGIGHQQPA